MLPLVVPLHGIGSRRDLPLPFEAVVAGAAVVLVITFAVALFAWRRRRFPAPGGIALPGLSGVVDHPATRVAGGVASWAIMGWFAAALAFGQDRLTNPGFGYVFVLTWVGLVPVSLLCGDVWRALQPVRLLATGIARLRRHDPDARGDRLSRWGVWPAAAGVVAFAWLELVQPGRATQPVLLAWFGAWLAWLVAGTVVFGRRWVDAADPFTAYAGLVATLSPWQRVDGVIRLTNPLRHLATARAPRGTLALVAALLGATAFDSFGGGTWWVSTMQAARGNPVLWGSAGLAGMIGIVAVTLRLAIASMRPWLAADAPDRVATMAATCAPIVAGYALGHYASLLWIEGQRTLINASDPFGRGWNVFGTAELGVNTTIFDYPTFVAIVQLVCIVGGHVLGVLAAHERALGLLRRDGVLRGQIGMLAVMVGYTCAGLLLLFSA